MSKRREKVIINVLWDEEANEYYRIQVPGTDDIPPLSDLESGVFLREDDLDEWIEYHTNEAKDVRVVKDYRRLT